MLLKARYGLRGELVVPSLRSISCNFAIEVDNRSRTCGRYTTRWLCLQPRPWLSSHDSKDGMLDSWNASETNGDAAYPSPLIVYSLVLSAIFQVHVEGPLFPLSRVLPFLDPLTQLVNSIRNSHSILGFSVCAFRVEKENRFYCNESVHIGVPLHRLRR